MHNNLFYNKFISCLYIFRALCIHHQEAKIVLYSIWYHHTCRWPFGAQVERGLHKFLFYNNIYYMLLHVSSTIVLIIRRSKLYYTASGIVTPVGGRPVHRLREDWLECTPTSPLSTCAPDGHLQVWWYQMLYNTILTSLWWAHSALKCRDI